MQAARRSAALWRQQGAQLLEGVSTAIGQAQG